MGQQEIREQTTETGVQPCVIPERSNTIKHTLHGETGEYIDVTLAVVICQLKVPSGNVEVPLMNVIKRKPRIIEYPVEE